ncbi:MarR family transcriptional regulator [Corynebacterium striatum]|nr:MarR family transcriptional regulator [Corynebacterium striatum]
MIHTAKAHDVAKGETSTKGTTVLVDRLWPRGISKEDLRADEWLKDVAPTPQLRKWWNHDPDSFDEFAKRYRAELEENDSDDMETLRSLADIGAVTLLFAAKDREVNHAVVLKDWLESQLNKKN